MIARIPLAAIERIGVYLNTNRRTMARVKAETGADYLLNGTLFNMASFTAANWLVVDGVTYSKAGNPFGYSMRDGKVVFSYANEAKGDDFVGAYPLLVRNGKLENEKTPAGLSGTRARSAMGLTPDSLILYCAPETSGATLPTLAHTMLSQGCLNAINFDGGASSQCDFNGQRISGGRIVYDYLCVWLKKATETEGKKMYVICTAKTSVYTADGTLEKNRYIAKGDKCTIIPTVNSNLLISVTYPTATGVRFAYIKSLVNFTKA